MIRGLGSTAEMPISGITTVAAYPTSMTQLIAVTLSVSPLATLLRRVGMMMTKNLCLQQKKIISLEPMYAMDEEPNYSALATGHPARISDHLLNCTQLTYSIHR